MVRRKQLPPPSPAPEAVAPAQDDVSALLKPTGKRAKNRHPCGFCSAVSKSTPRCSLCPGTIKNADPRQRDRIWVCPCWQANPEVHTKARDYRAVI